MEDIGLRLIVQTILRHEPLAMVAVEREENGDDACVTANVRIALDELTNCDRNRRSFPHLSVRSLS